MTRDHRFYHRRHAQAATRVVVVNVEIVASVDSSGKYLGQETIISNDPSAPPSTPTVLLPPAVPVLSLPQVPSVPPFPTDALPVVPLVPPFPSGFSVPGYPVASGASAPALQVSTGSANPSLSSTAASPSENSVTSTPLSRSTSLASLSSTSSTSSRQQIASIAAVNSIPSISELLSSSLPASSVMSFINTGTDESTLFFTTGSTTASSNLANPSNMSDGGGGAGQPGGPAPAAHSSSAAGAGSSGSTTPLAPPQVVGSVVGSLAGAALILAVILILLRRHKRNRQGALQLNDESSDRAPMSQVPREKWITPAFLNRFSGISRSTVETSTSGGERSFQRVSGRKLPSAFSEGMTSEQFAQGGSPYYQDAGGLHGAPGYPKELGKEANIRPSPARTPVIRHPDEEANPFADPAPLPTHSPRLGPPQSPNPRRGTLGRSLQSADGSRSSKFTENV